jgi:hypothetical protein
VAVEATGFVSSTVEATAVEDRLLPVQVKLAEKPALLHMRANKRARILIDGREVGLAPLPGPVELSPGQHELAVTKPGRVPGVRALVLGRGEERRVKVDLPRTVQREVALGLLGSSAVLWVAGAATMGAAFRFQQRAQEVAGLGGMRNIDEAQRQGLADDVQRRDRLRGATIGLWTAAAVTGIMGLILVLADRR